MLLVSKENFMPRDGNKFIEAAENYRPTLGRLFDVAFDEGYEYTTNKMFSIIS